MALKGNEQTKNINPKQAWHNEKWPWEREAIEFNVNSSAYLLCDIEEIFKLYSTPSQRRELDFIWVFSTALSVYSVLIKIPWGGFLSPLVNNKKKLTSRSKEEMKKKFFFKK